MTTPESSGVETTDASTKDTVLFGLFVHVISVSPYNDLNLNSGIWLPLMTVIWDTSGANKIVQWQFSFKFC